MNDATHSTGSTTPAGSAHQGTPRRSSSAKIHTAEMVTCEVLGQKIASEVISAYSIGIMGSFPSVRQRPGQGVTETRAMGFCFR